MGKDPDIPFLRIVHEAFDSTLQRYGFEFSEKSAHLAVAKKGDIEIIFRLEPVPLFWYFSLEIKLSGKLGEQATLDSSRRHFGVTAIAKSLDPNYTMNLKASQTEEDLRERLEIEKKDLLKYCEGILLGDVSNWQKMVESLS